MNTINLNSFLKFGYFLDYKNPNYKIKFSGIDKEKYKYASESELIDIGIKLFKEVIQKQFKYNEKHVVPLSGGFDSRAILATLLEFTEAKNIYTYTWGIPGAFDYKIGNLIAKKIGTVHNNFLLTDYVYSNDELIDISKRSDSQTLLFHHVPIWQIDNLYKGMNIWSGFLGDTVAGKHTIIGHYTNMQKAKEYFLKKIEYVKSIKLSNIRNSKFYHLIDLNEITNVKIPLEDQINFIHGEIKSVAPYLLIKYHKNKAPHFEKEYFNFMLSQEDKYRYNRYLYKKILSKCYPRLFQLPIKDNYGLPLNAGKSRILIQRAILKAKKISNKYFISFINPYVHYMDFDEVIRSKKDLKIIIYENIMDLKKRKIVEWIDIDSIWRRHINKSANHADALLTLASLEIHLKAGKKL